MRRHLGRSRDGFLDRAVWSASCYVLIFFAFLLRHATAHCECGFSAAIEGTNHIFTDLLESDFTRERDIADNTDWRRQAFNMTSERARGDFGEMFVSENVGFGPGGAKEGLQLVVQGQTVDSMVPNAEIDSDRGDILWGTFRASLKLTSTPGTCAAFFWYHNDTAEIDMEFLSKDFRTDNNSYPVSLVLQSREAAQAGYNAQSTGNFIKAYLPFNPTSEFHEYRFDFVPDRVVFYADGQLLGSMNGTAVPRTAGHLVLQHWSNGNPLWSGGPPATDAVLSVKYVKAYFNSSAAERDRDWAKRCSDAGAPQAVCEIPEITATNSSAGQFFFSDRDNMTNNQTVSGKSGGQKLEYKCTLPVTGILLACGLVLGLW